MRDKNIYKVVSTALLVAIEIILSRFLSISTPIVKISFSFVPLSMVAALYGPVYSCAAAAMSDFIGAMLFPTGAYFPGYTLTAALTGLTYGLFLHRRRGWVSIVCAVLSVNLLWRLGLNSFWVQMTTGKAMIAFMSARVIKTLVTIPIEVLLIKLTRDRLCPMLQKTSR